MQWKLAATAATALDCDALILIEFEGEKRKDLAGQLAAYYESGEITGKSLEFTLLHAVAGYKARRIVVAGAGKRVAFDSQVLGRVAAAAGRFLKSKGVKHAAFLLEGGMDVAAVAEGFTTGVWEPDHLKTAADKDSTKAIETVTIAVADGNQQVALDRGVILGDAINLARDIGVAPPNLLTPTTMAARAMAVAKENGFSCEVLDRDRIQQLGMGALLGVAQGSAEPPAMIVMEYKPVKASSDARLGIIGKGVTFDTGGISIKPSEGMEKMKYDMAAGAAVIGAMQAIAKLKPSVAVVGIVPAVENMPGSKAQRPGDIVTSLSGKTIEILNTDAEGRLILADAITYAKQLGCTHLVDAATLTGAMVVALGHERSGVFTNNDEFLERWMAASRSSGEKMWHMPLDDEYRDYLKTVYADIGNIGGRWGGACTAAMFLKEFVGDTPWVHADVAGTAWLDDAKPYMAKGPTGIPLGTFVHLALNWK